MLNIRFLLFFVFKFVVLSLTLLFFNSRDTLAAINLNWPVTNIDRITSKFGDRGGRHQGVDIAGSENSSILAAHNGVVSFVGKKTDYGKTVVLSQGNYKTLYAHLASYNVRKYQKVKQGDVIGYMGETGNATGVHLHFELKRYNQHLNPLHYLY